MADDKSTGVKILAADIIASFVTGNQIAGVELPKLIADVVGALQHLGDEPAVAPEAPAPKLTTAQIRRSITPDAIRCLECDRPFKTLRRHLGSTHGLTPDEYRLKYALPADYPLVSETTSKVRSDFAKTIGLGRTAGRKAGKGKTRAPRA